MKAKFLKIITADKWFCAETNSYVAHNVKMKRGEYILIAYPKSGIKAIIACPQCGEKNPITTHKVRINIVKPVVEISIMPSINNNQCCGYHGYLSKNIFTNVK